MSDLPPRVSFNIEPLTEPEPGQWCDNCLLPSAVRADLALSVIGSATEDPRNNGFAIVTCLWCTCGWMKREQTTKGDDPSPTMTDDPRG